MKAQLVAVFEVVTVFGFSLAATVLLAASLTGTIKQAENPRPYATASQSKAAAVVASDGPIFQLPAIEVLGSRNEGAARENAALAQIRASASKKQGG